MTFPKSTNNNIDFFSRILGVAGIILSAIGLWFQFSNYKETRPNLEIITLPGSRTGIFKVGGTDVQTFYNCIMLIRLCNKSNAPISITGFYLHDVNKNWHYVQPLNFSQKDLPEFIVEEDLQNYKLQKRDDMIMIPSVMTLTPAQTVQGFVIYKGLPLAPTDFGSPLFDKKSESKCMRVELEVDTTGGRFKSEEFYLFRSRRADLNYRPMLNTIRVRPLL